MKSLQGRGYLRFGGFLRVKGADKCFVYKKLRKNATRCSNIHHVSIYIMPARGCIIYTDLIGCNNMIYKLLCCSAFKCVLCTCLHVINHKNNHIFGCMQSGAQNMTVVETLLIRMGCAKCILFYFKSYLN